MSNHRLEQVENELGSLATGQRELQQVMRTSEECLLKHMENMFARFSTHNGGHDNDAESSRGPVIAPRGRLSRTQSHEVGLSTLWWHGRSNQMDLSGGAIFQVPTHGRSGETSHGMLPLEWWCPVVVSTFQTSAGRCQLGGFQVRVTLRYGPSKYQIFLGISLA